ncbi:helix-turn-helix transcriptional regulator [Actinomycetospora soli]|uniref:helix-turn-helix transcriptional regulator n=1 Tax=Actinomycetospora soli TaxID=2893887 RepID=UPI001E53F8D9|nr:helix-turn-helix transcriptional regulator [Actinomycetospora soli]MCD2190991.1 helix-turn-helix domain-containing protein [Actinomycetospora soli]
MTADHDDHGDVERFYREFGQRLHDARTAARISQEALGRVVGLNRTSISNIEKGRQRLLAHQLPVLARALETTTEELMPAGPAMDTLKGLMGADRDAVLAVRRARGSGQVSQGVSDGVAR